MSLLGSARIKAGTGMSRRQGFCYTMNFTWPHAPKTSSQDIPDRHLWLRILETTDVHAHLVPYDYHRQVEAPGYGLARTATLIDRARTEAANSVLFDNGDFLQGSVLGDIAVGPDSDWTGPHPMIQAMNRLGYDAAALGNHEFNQGLDWLSRALDDAQFPVLCANALLAGQGDATLRPATALLTRTLRDSQGNEHTLRLGLLGLLPPQIASWDHVHLRDRVVTRGIVETAMAQVPRLRDAGADIVIALAHTGIGSAPARPEDADPGQENAALALATVPGIDAVLAGHSHQVFPNAAAAPAAQVDHDAGTLAGVPAVMAGYRGSHLGVLDLCLVQTDNAGWSVHTSHSRARPVRTSDGTAQVPADAALLEVARPAHLATLDLVTRPLARTARPLHSYLAQLRPCNTLGPVLAAKAAALSAALAGTPDADLPVLAATTCFKSGGHGGPGNYIDIPAGALTLGHMAELYPFPNTLVGLRMTGADLADWLERAASCFHQVLPGMGATPQPLWNAAFAIHAFDTVSDLSYRIDLGQPPRYDADGRLLNPQARRIRDLRHRGAPIAPEALFCMATNNFRAFGGGPYPPVTPGQIVHQSQTSVRDLLAAHMRREGEIGRTDPPGDRTFDGPSDATLLVETGPGVRNHPNDLAAVSAREVGVDAQGFLRLAVPLAALTDLANPGETS